MISTATPRQPRMYIHAPAVVFAARVNLVDPAEYPIQFLAYDNVTEGDYTAIKPGMTLLLGTTPGGDDLGRQRVTPDSTTIVVRVGYTSRGTRDGELLVVDNAYITVLDDRRLWMKRPFIDAAGEQFKDRNISVGTNTTDPPPVAIINGGTAGTAVAGFLNVMHIGQLSYAVADGATITNYLWNIGDGILVSGALTDDFISVQYPPGFRYVSLTVTDSNGKTHTTERPIFVDDPDDRRSIDTFKIANHAIDENGVRLAVRITQDLPRITYPDGTLIMIWDKEPAGTASREHMLFVGWEHSINAVIQARETGLLRNTVLTLFDVGSKMNVLPGFSQTISSDVLRDPAAEPEITWQYMTNPTIDKVGHYLAQWHSNLLDIAAVFPSGTGDLFPIAELQAGGGSLLQQLRRLAGMLVPDYRLLVDNFGQIKTVPDLNLLDVLDRTSTIIVELEEDEWSEVSFDYERPPRVGVLWGQALLTADTYITIDDATIITNVRSIAPGEIYGQGISESTWIEQLARSQADLNAVTGHRYARMNSPYGPLMIQVPGDLVRREIDYTVEGWVLLHCAEQYATQRGLPSTLLRGMLKALSINYGDDETDETLDGLLTIELETSGSPAFSWDVETGASPDDGDWTPPPIGLPFVPPDFGDPSIFYGDINPYVLWSGNHIFRTWDLQAATPSWHLIDNGISGNIYDCQYVNVDENTIGAWLMTSTAIWWCADILAFIPVWTAVLPIATVQAAEAAPIDGSSGFKSMFHYWSAPGHLCVATGPVASDSQNRTWPHAYFWVTEDFGANWTMVDMDSFLFATGGYCYTSIYSMNVFRSAPGTIYCVRSTPTYIGNNSEMCVFLSSDLGYTWSKGAVVREDLGANQQVSSLLHPFPDADDPSYVVAGNFGPSDYIGVARTVDEWATSTVLTNNGTPTGYTRMANLWRVNSRTFDPLHVMGWFLHTSSGFMHLLESYDSGATWALLWNSGIAGANIPNTGTGSNTGSAQGGSQHNTPNGWPPDVDQWVVVRAVTSAGSTTGAVLLTLDNFATAPTSKVGNLNGLLGGNNWQSGPCDGFALPKIGLAASDPPHAQGIVVRTAAATGVQSAPTASIASTGVVEGDTVQLHLRLADNIAPTSVPSGFTLISNGEVTGTASIRIYSKIAGPSEPATYDFTFASGTARLGLAAIYSAEGRVLVLDDSANQSNGSSVNWVAPSVTTTQPNTLLMCFYSSAAENQESNPQAGMTKGYDTTGANGVHMQYQTRGVVGATGTRTMSITIQTSRTVTTAWREVL